MKDCPETSGNLRKPAAEVSGRFPAGFQKLDKITGIFSYVRHVIVGLELPVILAFYWKPAGNLRGRFPEVSGQPFIDGPHGT